MMIETSINRTPRDWVCLQARRVEHHPKGRSQQIVEQNEFLSKYAIWCKEIPMHWDERFDTEILRHLECLANRHVSDDPAAISIVVAFIHGQECHLDWQQLR